MVNGGIARSPDKSPTPVSPVLHSAATRGGPQPTLFSDDNEDMIIDSITSKIHLVCSLN